VDSVVGDDDANPTTGAALSIYGGAGIGTDSDGTATLSIVLVPSEVTSPTWGAGATNWTFESGAVDPVFEFTSGNVKYSGATTYTFEGGASDPVWTPGDGWMNLSTGELREGGVAVLTAEVNNLEAQVPSTIENDEMFVGSGPGAGSFVAIPNCSDSTEKLDWTGSAWACVADVGGSSDVSAVGDCSAGECFDGTSDGGTTLTFYDVAGNAVLAWNGSNFDFSVPVTATSFAADDTTSEPGNLMALNDNSTPFTNDPTCANSGTANMLTILDVDEGVGDDWQICDGTSILFDIVNTASDIIADQQLLVGTGTGTGAYVTMSGDGTISNTGALSVVDTACSGSTTYLDGNGGCDELSAVYQAKDDELTTLAGLIEAQGSIIIGDAGPAWSALAIGAPNTVLLSNGTTAAWDATPAIDGTDFTNIPAAADLADITNVTLTTPADGGVLCFTGTGNASNDCTVGGDATASETAGELTLAVVNTKCTGTSEYLDGGGECDDISGIYSPIAGSASIATVGTITAGAWQSTTDVGVAYGGTGLSAGTSGGILGYTATGTLASTATLGAGNIVVGGGAGVVPTQVTAGATTTVLVGGGEGTAPEWTTATGSGAPARAVSPVFTTSLALPQGTNPTADAAGEIAVDADDNMIRFYGSAAQSVRPGEPWSFNMESPLGTEDMGLFYTDVAITMVAPRCVIRGSTSVTISIMHNTDRSAAGNNVGSAATVVSSTTSGTALTLGGDVTIPAASWVWVESSAVSGTPDELTCWGRYTYDQVD